MKPTYSNKDFAKIFGSAFLVVLLLGMFHAPGWAMFWGFILDLEFSILQKRLGGWD